MIVALTSHTTRQRLTPSLAGCYLFERVLQAAVPFL